MVLIRNWIYRFIWGMMAFLLPFFLISTSHSFAMTSESYMIPSGVLSGGGTVDATSSSYKLQDVSAQPGTIGTEESDSYKVEGGFIYTVPVIAEIPGVPSIESVDPDVGTRGATADISIEGSYTHFTTTSEALFYGTEIGMTGITVTSTEFVSTIEVVAHITIEATASLGVWSVHVQTGDELVTKEACFTVTAFEDTQPPVISNVKFDGRPYFEGDIISATPRISGNITDESGVDPDYSIEYIFINTQTAAELVITGEAYIPLDNSFEYTIIDPIPAGSYHLAIRSKDGVGNEGVSWVGTVEVMGGPAQLVGPVLSYPSVFKPLTGTGDEKTAILAYTLSADVDIVIYMYDVSGQVIKTWRISAGEEGGRAGYNGVTWDGMTDFDTVVANGIHVYKIISGNKVIGTGKLVVLD